MTIDVQEWLESIGLPQYSNAFEENAIDDTLLPHLTDQDFKELGVSKLGDRKRLTLAISRLRGESRNVSEHAAASDLPENLESDAQRRLLTVLFCDLVASTEMSRRLDPEDLRDIVRKYQDAVAGAVSRYRGHVAKYLGDGVLAYFGWPVAYEDQSERAVRAGLAAIAAVGEIADPGGAPLKARVGIATGRVVVGDLVGQSGRDAAAVSGETPNLAARLQQIAAPGQLVISDRTRRFVGYAFTLSDLGFHELKGFDGRIQTWAVIGEEPTESRFGARHGTSMTRLVGRRTELALLRERWQLAEVGEGQVVMISGEAGIGKSRLLEGLQEAVVERSDVVIRLQCSPYHQNSSLYPAIRQLENSAGFSREDTAETKLDKLESLLAQSGCDGEIQLFAHLLSLPSEHRYGPLSLPPQQTKDRLLEALAAHLLQLSRRKPVLLLCEDTHWIDPTSGSLLDLIIGRIAKIRGMLVVTHRLDWQIPAQGYDHITALRLSRLSKEHSAELARAVAGTRGSDEIVGRVTARTDGIPLFIEELTKSYIDDRADLDENEIPTTLQSSLLTRIDRLEPKAKEIAQIGAVVGREFSRDVLAAIVKMNGQEFDDAIEDLVNSELVFPTGLSSEPTYSFKHALVQDAVYDSLLRARRQKLHASIARVLRDRLVETEATGPEVVAHHFFEAGEHANSIRYWMAAAEQALSRASYSEAETFVCRGLAATANDTDTNEGSATIVDLHLLKYAAYYPRGDPQTLLNILSEAEAAVVRLNDVVRTSKVLSTQTYVLASSGQVAEAVKLGHRNLEGLPGKSDVNLYCHGKQMLGRALFAAGRYADALGHLTDATECVGSDVEQGRDLHGLSHAINLRAYSVLCHAERGEFQAGLELCRQVDDLLRMLRGGVHERLWMRNVVGRLKLLAGDFSGTVAVLEPVLSQIRARYPVYFPRAASSLGAAYAVLAQLEKGMNLLWEAHDYSNESGFRFGHPIILSNLAEAMLLAGQDEEARDTAKLAIDIGRSSGERGNEAWAIFTLGHVDEKLRNPTAALENYRRAFTIGSELEMVPLKAKCEAGLERIAGV